MPIKCGVHTIGFFTIGVAIYLTFSSFTQFLNVYFAWWYTAILLLLYIPLYIAVYFFWRFIYWKEYKESKVNRGRLVLACILAIVSLILGLVWCIIFITQIYKEEQVYTTPEPWNEDSYIAQSDK